MPSSPTVSQRRAKLASFLEKSILRGDLREGSQLPTEKELQLKFGVSRSVVREVLQALKAKGLIDSQRGSGSYVSGELGQGALRDAVSRYSTLVRDGDSFLELMDLRLLMECFCLRRLKGERLAAGRAMMRQKLEAMKVAAANSQAFGRADIAFHQAIAAASGHRLFDGILQGLLADQGMRFAKETYINAELTRKSLKDHTAILQALEKNDLPLAEARLRRHLLNSRRHLQALLIAAGAPPPPA